MTVLDVAPADAGGVLVGESGDAVAVLVQVDERDAADLAAAGPVGAVLLGGS